MRLKKGNQHTEDEASVNALMVDVWFFFFILSLKAVQNTLFILLCLSRSAVVMETYQEGFTDVAWLISFLFLVFFCVRFFCICFFFVRLFVIVLRMLVCRNAFVVLFSNSPDLVLFTAGVINTFQP